MKYELSKKQIDDYQENGFLVIENFLTPQELQRWQHDTDEAVAQRLELQPGFLNNQANPDDFYSRVFTQCLRLADTHDGMHELMHDPMLGQMIARLSGVNGIRIWHDQALYKPPFGNPTGWHLDNPYWSFYHRQSISIWVALDDATLSNGCLYYIPGSHRQARNDNVGISSNIGALFNTYPEWRSIQPVACPCQAGTAVLHSGYTAHGAGANMTISPRRAMTCAYMPDGSTFNGQRNILPEKYFQSLKIGDLLQDNEVNPLIWKEN